MRAGTKSIFSGGPEFLGKEGNILLKLIEEPPPGTLLMLVAEEEEKILPTHIVQDAIDSYQAYPDFRDLESIGRQVPDRNRIEPARSPLPPKEIIQKHCT
ncbi:MAG: hypothetical protein KL787_06000 [Taibaiella sp.]|nr:hypothetical protein [Taibaiella sp.]